MYFVPLLRSVCGFSCFHRIASSCCCCNRNSNSSSSSSSSSSIILHLAQRNAVDDNCPESHSQSRCPRKSHTRYSAARRGMQGGIHRLQQPRKNALFSMASCKRVEEFVCTISGWDVTHVITHFANRSPAMSILLAAVPESSIKAPTLIEFGKSSGFLLRKLPSRSSSMAFSACS